MDLDNPVSTTILAPQLQLKSHPGGTRLWDSDPSLPGIDQWAFITRIHAKNSVSGLSRIPGVGLHVAVQIGGETTKTVNRLMSAGKHEIEWDAKILLPSDRSAAVSFKVCASSGLESRRGNGALLRRFKTTVGDMLDRNSIELQRKFLDKMVGSSDPLLRIITESRICDVTSLPLLETNSMIGLAQLTSIGHRALERYHQSRNQRDLNEAITYFERVRDMCSPHYPSHTSALFNLATVKFVHCQDSDNYPSLNVSVSLYRDALQLRPSNHPGHPVTALDLCFALLAHLQIQCNRADRNGLCFPVVETFAYRVAWMALQLAGISVPAKMWGFCIPCAEHADPNDELIRNTRAMLLGLPNCDSRRPAVLAGLGSLLIRRFNKNGNLVDIHEAISVLEGSFLSIPNVHPRRVDLLSVLADSLCCRYDRLRSTADLTKSISMRQEAVYLTPDSDPEKPKLLNDLTFTLMRRYEHLGDIVDVKDSILIAKEVLHLTPNGHPQHLVALSNLANSSLSRFKLLDDLADLNKSIAIFDETEKLTRNGHPDRRTWLVNHGYSLYLRYERLGNLVDINRSISISEEVVYLSPSDHPDKPQWLSNLASSLSCRLDRLGDLEDMKRSISVMEEAVGLTPHDHPDKYRKLTKLGSLFSRRYKRLGELADLNKTILVSEEAMHLVPDGHPDQPGVLCNLGNSLSSRFKCLGDLADLNKSISILEKVVHLLPCGHSDLPFMLDSLGSALSSRFDRLGHLVDINKSVSVYEEAVRLIPHGHPDKPRWLSNLGNSLHCRFERLDDIADINKSISMLREALSLITTTHVDQAGVLNSLGNSIFLRSLRLGDLTDLNESHSVFEEAVRLTPNDHPDRPGRLNNLGNSLCSRFDRVGDLADINRSISVYEEALCLASSGHPSRPVLLFGLGNSLLNRYRSLGDLADVNKSISVLELTVQFIPSDHPDRPRRLGSLASSLSRRFDRLGDIADISRAISMEEEIVQLIASDHPDMQFHLNGLGNSLLRRFERTGDLEDINMSVSIFEDAARLTPDGHPCRPDRLQNLGSSLVRRFQRLHDFADFSKGISMLQEAMRLTPDEHPDRPAGLKNLGNAFLVWFQHSDDPAKLSAAISYYSAASRTSIGPVSDRFRAARTWTQSARLQGNAQGIFDAYATAIDLIPQLAWLGLPLQERHHVLLQAADIAREAAAVALETGQTERAVEWLEQGRSVVWSQLLQLRTPVDELRVEHPTIAHEFQQISRRLENASSNEGSTFSRMTNDFIVNTLGDGVVRRHDLALRRETLLAEIRSLPGFNRFLLPKTVEQLVPLASSGPVVYLNAGGQRCDALIVTAEFGNVVSVPLSISFTETAILHAALRLLLQFKGLIISREDISALIPSSEKSGTTHRLLDLLLADEDSDRGAKVKPQRIAGYTPDELFQRILAYLWVEVVKPVLTVLGFLTPPSANEKLPHIFWCPIGPFAFLPIHAAGLYGVAEADEKLCDFAISSYVPTLSALAPSTQKTSTRSPLASDIRLAAVPQPPTDGLAQLASVKEEIGHIKKLSANSPFVTLEESHGTVADVTEKMENADWVHFACHGVQDPHDPLDSGLCLADRRRLKLSDIIRLSRPQGGLAFLSACQTAQGDETLAEESVHLAAGMLLAGYGGVIATLWAIRDPDAPKVTKDVYEHLFRNGKVPDSTEAAEALHYAVQHLRESGAAFTSWVPFIHVGR